VEGALRGFAADPRGLTGCDGTAEDSAEESGDAGATARVSTEVGGAMVPAAAVFGAVVRRAAGFAAAIGFAGVVDFAAVVDFVGARRVAAPDSSAFARVVRAGTFRPVDSAGPVVGASVTFSPGFVAFLTRRLVALGVLAVVFAAGAAAVWPPESAAELISVSTSTDLAATFRRGALAFGLDAGGVSLFSEEGGAELTQLTYQAGL
jgi:hypothetical protein